MEEHRKAYRVSTRSGCLADGALGVAVFRAGGGSGCYPVCNRFGNKRERIAHVGVCAGCRSVSDCDFIKSNILQSGLLNILNAAEE